MIVGTVARNVTRYSVTSRRNSCGSNRGISTRWCPCSSPMANVVNSVLWLSGTDTKLTSPGCAPSGAPIVGGTLLSLPASMSLGRPVLPPDAMDFHTGETASGSGSSENPAAISTTAAEALGVSPVGSARPTSSAGGRSSSSAASSVSGSRAERGCGTAPSFQHASTAYTQSSELGSTIVT